MLLGVDVGGTFTDAVLVEQRRRRPQRKVPSTPGEQSAGVLEAVALVLQAAPAPSRGRRALRPRHDRRDERAAARAAPRAPRWSRPRLHRRDRARPPGPRRPVPALRGARPPPLVPAELRFAAPERMGPDGPLQRRSTRPRRASSSSSVARPRPQAVAVALLHSYADPAHERLLGELLARAAARRAACSLSSELVGHLPRVRAHRHDRRSTPRSRRCSAPTSRRLSRAGAARWTCPSPRSCSPPAGSPMRRAPARTPP